jgi:hypothetical protein
MATPIDTLLVRIEADLSGLRKDLDKVKKQTEGTGSAFSKLGGKIAGAFAAIGAGAAITKLISANATFQKLEASLITFTGSSEAAAAQFAKLQQFAATTPFALDEVVGGFNKLVARGLEPTIQTFAAFGDIASGTGKSLDQFVEAVADAAVGEFERLKEFGIKASQEGDKVKFTFGGVTTEVKKDSEAILGYLENLSAAEFAGSTARQADTLTGAFSNFGDAVDSFAVTIGKSGVNDFIVEFTRGLTDIISRMRDATAAGLNLTSIIRHGLFGKSGTDNLKDELERTDRIREVLKQIDTAMSNLRTEQEMSGGGFVDTQELERVRQLREELKMLYGVVRANTRGQGFVDPRALGRVGSIASQEKASKKPAEDAAKALKEENERIEKLVKETLGPDLIKRAKDIKQIMSIVDDQFFSGKIGVEQYEQAMQNLFKSTEKVGEAVEEVNSALGYAEDIKAAVAELITDNDVTRADAYTKKMEFLDSLYFDLGLSAEVYDAAVRKLTGSTQSLSEVSDEMTTVNKGLMDAFSSGANQMADSLASALAGMETKLSSFGDFARSIIQQVISMFIRMAIVNRIMNSVFGLSGDKALPTIPIPGMGGKAGGGRMQAGVPTLVGERGPELFIPSSSGSVLNNMNTKNALGGGAQIVFNQTVNVETGVSQTVRAEMLSLLPVIKSDTIQAVAEARRRGGSFAAAFGG